MPSVFSSPKPPKIETPPPPPVADPGKNADAIAAAAAEKKRARLAAGYSSTVLTGGAGLLEPASVGRATLLGQTS